MRQSFWAVALTTAQRCRRKREAFRTLLGRSSAANRISPHAWRNLPNPPTREREHADLVGYKYLPNNEPIGGAGPKRISTGGRVFHRVGNLRSEFQPSAQMKFTNDRPDFVVRREVGRAALQCSEVQSVSQSVSLLLQFEAANAGGPWQLSAPCSHAALRERPSMGKGMGMGSWLWTARGYHLGIVSPAPRRRGREGEMQCSATVQVRERMQPLERLDARPGKLAFSFCSAG